MKHDKTEEAALRHREGQKWRREGQKWRREGQVKGKKSAEELQYEIPKFAVIT